MWPTTRRHRRFCSAVSGLALALLVACAAAPDARLAMRRAVEIDRPRPQVFAFAADPMRDATWRFELRRIAGGALGPGAAYAEVVDVGTGTHEIAAVVTELDPPRRIVVRVRLQDGHDFEIRRTFAALAGGRTRMHYDMLASEKTIQAIFGAPIDPELGQAVIQTVMRANLWRLKRKLEAEG